MGRFTRIEFVLSTAAAYAAFGLDRHMVISVPAPDQQSAEPRQGFHRYKIGEAECIALYDGIWEKTWSHCRAHGVSAFVRYGRSF